MKIRSLFLFLLFFVLLTPFSLSSDQREEPIDVIIALDKSLSMVEEIDAVKEYVNSYLIDELLIQGDLFLVVAFYGQTEIPLSITITGPQDKLRAKQIISGLLADGRYTDIGNALDALALQLEKYSRPERKKFLLLITDGIQEAPPESKYYSPDGSFNHEFLQNTKVIQKMGWKIHILGMGTRQAAQVLAEELAGTYADLSEQPTAEELAEKTRDLLATIEVSGEVTMSAVDYRGRSSLSLSVESSGYADSRTVTVSGVRLTLPEGNEESILTDPVSFTVEPNSTASVDIPVQIPSPPAGGDYSGSLRFSFSSRDRFLPAVQEVSYHVKSFIENFWLWLLIAVLILIFLLILAVLLARRLTKVKHRFRLVVEGRKADKGEKVYRIVEGKPLYLQLSEGRIEVTAQRSPGSLARLMAIQKGVRLAVLDSSHFPKLQDVSGDILDFDIPLRIDLEKRKDIALRLVRA